ncbi:substrate-binding periplasmic protein [Bdellovibrio sp. HCB290]|uniref:substrate-binding periplasmic protein n=1 Tax=Bdellovibrio sp. HCB290 TaxID=3394356 RepID=UPI0039B6563C
MAQTPQTPQIILRYNVREPFTSKVKGAIKGLVGEPTIKAFEKAGIPYTLVENPPLRQLALLESGHELDCSAGWFRTPERIKKYKYTEAVQEDGPWVLIGHKGTIDPKTTTAEEILKNPKLKLLARMNYSMGAYLDSMIVKHKVTTFPVEVGTVNLLEIVKSGRVDYYFMPESEKNYVFKKQKLSESDFVILNLPDLPIDNSRHIICSKKVPDAIIEKLNKAILEGKKTTK